MSNLLQMTASPEQLAKLRAMAAMFGQPSAPGGQMQVSDETPTAPPPAPTLSGAAGTTGPNQPSPGRP